jgi:uncharacterized membrane protein
MDFSIERAFNFIGGGVCHQLSLRSFTAGGLVLPVCARCAGIYLGLFLSFLYIFIAYRKTFRGDDKTDLSVVIFAAVCILPLYIDGVTSYLLLRESNNLLRLITGVLTGCSLPLFIAFAGGKPFLTKKGFIVILSLCAAAAFLVYNSLINYYIISAVLCAGVFLLFFSVIKTVISALSKDETSIKIAYISAVTAVALISVLSLLHQWLIYYL